MGLDKSTEKVAKELRVQVEPEFKESEYTFTLLDSGTGAKDIAGWLKRKGLVAPPGANEAVGKYVAGGMKLLVAEVDEKRVELVGGRRAILSPIRFTTKSPVRVNSTLGLMNSGGHQELLVFTLDPEHRYEPKGYETVFPPTNVQVDFKVKERMGEFYAGLHDLIRTKHPKAMLVEYAWPTSGCGEPCPNEALMLHELLTLGADFFELDVSTDERNPAPPPLTDEETQKLAAMTEKADKDRFEKDRQEVMRRKALIGRHAYVLTRIHHRYDKGGLPSDIEIVPASHVVGGVEVPKGRSPELPTQIDTAAASRFQTRYTHFHPNKAVVNCERPEYGRWGKPPRSYLGLRKVWVAEDLARKDRESLRPAELVKTPVPSLGLAGNTPDPASADGGTADPAVEGDKGKSCGCRAVGGSSAPSGLGASAVLAVLGGLFGRRRFRRH
jgi:MYXO-CTERM domain-containing protein